MTRREILKQADICVNGDRDQSYGSPENSFEVIAAFWRIYLAGKGIEDPLIDAKDVAAMMGLFKIARIATGKYKDDNWVDLAGYAACGGEIEAIYNGLSGLNGESDDEDGDDEYDTGEMIFDEEDDDEEDSVDGSVKEDEEEDETVVSL